MNFRNTLTILLLACITTASAVETEESRELSFQVYLWQGGTPAGVKTIKKPGSDTNRNDEAEGIFLMDAYEPPLIQYCPTGINEAVQVNALEQRLSPRYKYTGTGPLQFFQDIPQSDGTIQRKQLGIVDLPANDQHALLIFYPKKLGGGYDIYPINNSLESIPAGKSRIYNLTTTPIACMFNEQSLRLMPGGSDTASLGPQEDFFVVVRIGAPNEEGKWRERYAQRLRVNPEASILTLIYKKSEQQNAYRIVALEMPSE
ncbi:hypothetical protein [Coraliomargarita parva]|uniref:hypothetical protein n=1 Tax=Coraliomargarita parva TaxID=3014050 RepID=UPI0022B555A2|nr:hypothetical protein [Coraliomargarita parva]